MGDDDGVSMGQCSRAGEVQLVMMMVLAWGRAVGLEK